MLNVVRWLIFDSSQLFFIVWRKDQMLCWLFSCPIHLYDHLMVFLIVILHFWWSFWFLPSFLFVCLFGLFQLFCVFCFCFFILFYFFLFIFPSALHVYSIALAVLLLYLIFIKTVVYIVLVVVMVLNTFFSLLWRKLSYLLCVFCLSNCCQLSMFFMFFVLTCIII